MVIIVYLVTVLMERSTRIDRRNAWSLKFVNVDQNCPQPEVTG